MGDKKFRAIVIQPDTNGEIVEIDDTLQALNDIVGGYIEGVYSSDMQTCFYINEEGKLKGLQPNIIATFLWWEAIGGPEKTVGQGDVLVGPVIVCGGPAFGPESTNVTDERIEAWKELCARVSRSQQRLI